MNVPLTWDSGLSMLALGLLDGAAVEVLATTALARGLDSPAMRRLAGGSPPDQVTPTGEFTRALQQLNVIVPPPPEAARQLTRVIAAELVAGRTHPFEGARQIAALAYAVGDTFHDVDPFIYAWSEGESRPTDRSFFAAAILQEARRWHQTGKGSV